jgi:hypothetical protein
MHLRLFASADFPLQGIERTVSASTAAAVAATTMISGRENDGLSFLVIIAGNRLGKRTRLCGREAGCDDATPAHAGDVAGVLGNANEQLGFERLLGAPAPTFVGVGANKMALVGSAAERALPRLAIHGGTTPVLLRDVTRHG